MPERRGTPVRWTHIVHVYALPWGEKKGRESGYSIPRGHALLSPLVSAPREHCVFSFHSLLCLGDVAGDFICRRAGSQRDTIRLLKEKNLDCKDDISRQISVEVAAVNMWTVTIWGVVSPHNQTPVADSTLPLFGVSPVFQQLSNISRVGRRPSQLLSLYHVYRAGAELSPFPSRPFGTPSGKEDSEPFVAYRCSVLDI